ncbi:hypothetical protein HY745_12850 [Candidatus Desantisbacteria bacterium]|nr:hypothetical protein [Candidatus Desantisbacteria bacterium]
MSLNAVSATNNNTGLINSTAVKTLGFNEFLKILITELNHQNPMEPLESRDYIAQVAQFASLGQMQDFNTSIQNLSGMQKNMNNVLTSTFIGKEVKSDTDSIYLKGDSPVNINYKLDKDFSSVSLELYNNYGTLVSTVEMGPKNEGEQIAAWDGKDFNGEPLSSGDFFYKIKAKNTETGKEVEIPGYIKGVVDGVIFDENMQKLIIGDQKVLLSSISGIYESKK